MPFLTQGKTNWKYILILVILTVIAGGGIFSYLKYFERKIEPLTQFSKIKIPEKPAVNKVAEWITEEDYSLHFSIKYNPINWRWNDYFLIRNLPEESISTIPLLGRPSLVTSATNVTSLNNFKSKCDIFFVRSKPVNRTTEETYKDLDELIKDHKKGLENLVEEIKEEKIIIDDIPGVKLSYIIPAGKLSPKFPYRIHRIFIPLSNGQTFQIGYYGPLNDSECETEFNQMLLTFRFISDFKSTRQRDEETGWIIGKSEEYGVEIKYPESMPIFPSTVAPSSYLIKSDWTCRPEPGSKGRLVTSLVTCQFAGSISVEEKLYYSFTSELRIGASSDPNDVKNCLNFWNLPSENVNINGKEFKKFKTSDAAAGHRANIEVYRTIHNGICFSIEKLEYGYLYDELENPSSSHYNLQDSKRFNSCRKITEQMLFTFRFLK